MDIALTENLDLLIIDNTLAEQENGETTMLQAFFSDARVKEQRGYWLDLPLSEIWQYDQSRLTNETANNLNETAKEIAKELVAIGLYNRIETKVSINDGILTLHIMCYDTRNIIINRKFAI
jgi:phage gp46-like protein